MVNHSSLNSVPVIHHYRKHPSELGIDGSKLLANGQASVLIEYFERSKPHHGHHEISSSLKSHNPSVRVHLRPEVASNFDRLSAPAAARGMEPLENDDPNPRALYYNDNDSFSSPSLSSEGTSIDDPSPVVLSDKFDYQQPTSTVNNSNLSSIPADHVKPALTSNITQEELDTVISNVISRLVLPKLDNITAANMAPASHPERSDSSAYFTADEKNDDELHDANDADHRHAKNLSDFSFQGGTEDALGISSRAAFYNNVGNLEVQSPPNSVSSLDSPVKLTHASSSQHQHLSGRSYDSASHYIASVLKDIVAKDSERKERDDQFLEGISQIINEIRLSINDVKELIEMESQKNVELITNNVATEVSKIKGPRPFPSTASLFLADTTIQSQKKNNIFKKALGNISNKNDMLRVEQLLVEILSQVEHLDISRPERQPLDNEASLQPNIDRLRAIRSKQTLSGDSPQQNRDYHKFLVESEAGSPKTRRRRAQEPAANFKHPDVPLGLPMQNHKGQTVSELLPQTRFWNLNDVNDDTFDATAAEKEIQNITPWRQMKDIQRLQRERERERESPTSHPRLARSPRTHASNRRKDPWLHPPAIDSESDMSTSDTGPVSILASAPRQHQKQDYSNDVVPKLRLTTYSGHTTSPSLDPTAERDDVIEEQTTPTKRLSQLKMIFRKKGKDKVEHYSEPTTIAPEVQHVQQRQELSRLPTDEASPRLSQQRRMITSGDSPKPLLSPPRLRKPDDHVRLSSRELQQQRKQQRQQQLQQNGQIRLRRVSSFESENSLQTWIDEDHHANHAVAAIASDKRPIGVRLPATAEGNHGRHKSELSTRTQFSSLSKASSNVNDDWESPKVGGAIRI
ncbi:hypothetical protein V1514DRAFT_11306 [Lipomyces japonicus]|uniref:uncharacterized protein n=1 Tax=Lipomyces japonicus TaxID=56871 RepID=UPI0034CF3DEC